MTRAEALASALFFVGNLWAVLNTVVRFGALLKSEKYRKTL
jgi:hypothetical protein